MLQFVHLLVWLSLLVKFGYILCVHPVLKGSILSIIQRERANSHDNNNSKPNWMQKDLKSAKANRYTTKNHKAENGKNNVESAMKPKIT